MQVQPQSYAQTFNPQFPTPQSTQEDPQHPETAGFFKKMGDSFSHMFSNMAFGMGMGETYRLIEAEFRQVDLNMDGNLNIAEFTMGTLNPFEFQAADRNFDNRVELREYANYRKEKLESAFQQKDVNSDRHISVGEIGSVGRMYLANRDVRVDANQDGLLNRREFVRANLTLGISIRDALGF